MRKRASTCRTIEERRKQAEELSQQRSLLSPEAQLKVLDERLGEGKGAERERNRLLRQIENRRPKKETKNSQNTEGKRTREKAKVRRNAQRKRN